MMTIYMAPMEGVTGYQLRGIHREMYQGVDKYFIPFIEPHVKRDYNSKEKNEICRRNNRVCAAVPQILTKNAEDFLRTAKVLCAEGYDEINLNLGCPSGTVVAKGKGAGFLENRTQLDEFLARIYEEAPCAISIKTRIGRYEREEFPKLIEIYNRYPVHELIVHPRTREDYYRNEPDWEMFAFAAEQSNAPICYNGDITSLEDYYRFRSVFPQVQRLMIGRGLVGDPTLAEQIREAEQRDLKGQAEGHKETPGFSKKQIGGSQAWTVNERRALDLAAGQTPGGVPEDKTERFWQFHDRIFREYCETMSGDNAVLCKMKELWNYWQRQFPDREKTLKKIRKAKKRDEYLNAVSALR